MGSAAVPVRDHTAAVVGALSASGPAYRLTKARIEAMAADLKAAGLQTSHRLGYLS